MNTEIVFPDGYLVKSGNRGMITCEHGGKTKSIHASHYVEIDEKTTPGCAKFLKSAGRPFSDYLGCEMGKVIIRAGNGVRELIAEVNRIDRDARTAADEQRARAIAAERAAALSASRFPDPVAVHVREYDGYPHSIRIEGHEPFERDIDWSLVEIGPISVASNTLIERLVSQRELEKQVEQRRVEEKKRVDSLALDQSKTTGSPVCISRWTTNRCMSNKTDCSFDNASRCALPNGTIEVRHTCCY